MQRLLLLTLLLCLAHVVRGVVMPGAPPHARIALGSGVASHPVLAPLCHAAERAAAESTGIGGESSGQGRPEWGTWCDTDLYDVAREYMNRVGWSSQLDNCWPDLWEAAGGESPTSCLHVAGGEQWDLLLHIFSPEAQPHERFCRWRQSEGALSLLRPLLGSILVSKLRPSGEALGTPRELTASAAYGQAWNGGTAKSSESLLQIGGPTHEYRAMTSSAALLELVLRHDTQENLLPIMPRLPQTEEMLDAFIDAASQPRGGVNLSPFMTDPHLRGDDDDDDEPHVNPAQARREALENALSSNVGGLEGELESIVRRVLASRADPAAARRLGVGHVRGVLLSGPPGCGKTLLARELARSLGARPPQIVNGPEIMDKFVGEAEKKVRALFAPAEDEYAAAGDASELHVIVLDEMDAFARKRGTLHGDSTGVRDSVVNQLLAKMDGVVEAGNVLVVGITNRPELIDEALLRPGRLEVHLEVTLPDRQGRRDILRIHTRPMRANEALTEDAEGFVEGLGDDSLAARTGYFSGAELAGLVRSAASFALGRAALAAAAPPAKPKRGSRRARRRDEEGYDEGYGGEDGDMDGLDALDDELDDELDEDEEDEKDAWAGIVTRDDFEKALEEVTPAMGKKDAELRGRFVAHGIGAPSHKDLERELLSGIGGERQLHSVLLVGEGHGAGVSALAASAAAHVSDEGEVDFVRFISADELLSDGGMSEGGRCAALAAKFDEAKSMGRALLVLDDIDCIAAGDAGAALSPVFLGTLRSLLRQPLPETSADASLTVIATVSDAATARMLMPLFSDTLVTPALRDATEAAKVLRNSPSLAELPPKEAAAAAELALADGPLGVKPLLLMAERALLRAAGAADKAGEKMDFGVAFKDEVRRRNLLASLGK